MGPMTKGSNLPYRRLCVELGARVTMSEMTVARRLRQRRRGEFALAQTRLAEFVAEDRRKLVSSSPPLLRVAVVEARLLSEQGRLSDAHALLNAALAEFDRRSATIRPRVLALVARSELMLKMSSAQQALEDAQRAMTVARITRGQNPYSDLVGLAALTQARAELALGHNVIAGRLLKEAVDNLQRTVGTSHPDVLASQELLGALQPMT